MESKKTSQTRKNRRRSSRNVVTNGDIEDSKERTGKRLRDSKDSENEANQDFDVYKDILDLVPAEHLNCSPTDFPAAPGTRVNLHGVILHETQGGLIVLNVRWRNKVFSGALIDAEKNKWASDQIKDQKCYDKNFQAPPPIKKIKIPTSSSANTDDADTKKKTVTSPTTPSKNSKSSRGNSKKRNSQDVTSPLPQEECTASKKVKTKAAPSDTFVCPEPNCNRKYKHKNGLSYHIKAAHENSQKNESFEEKSEDSDSGDDQFVIDEESKDDVTNESKVDPSSSQDGTEISDEGCEEKKEELTENEKKIERLKLSTEKALLYIKKESEASEMESVGHRDPIKEEGEVKPVVENEKCPNDNGLTHEQSAASVENGNVLSTDISPEEEKEEVETPNKPPVEIPVVQIDPAPASSSGTKEEKCPDVVVSPAVKAEDEHPKGSSQTIIHEDHVTSLNELFAPAQSYQQYSPTLSHLNPQTINDSLKEAKKSLGKDVENASSQAAAKTETSDVMKTQLAQKPSVEINHVVQETDAFENKMQLMKTYEMVNRVQNTTVEIVECSEDERSISPENMLNDCHKTYPQVERDVKVSKPNLMCMTMANTNIFMNPVVPSVLSQPSKAFENSLINKELAGKLSTTALSINSLQPKLAPSTLPFGDFVQYDSKSIPQLVNYFASNPILQNTDVKPSENGILDQKTGNTVDVSVIDSHAKPSLLKQRLLAPPPKPEVGLPVSSATGNQLFLQSSGVGGAPRQGDGAIELAIADKKTPSTFTINRERVNDKTKVPPNSLRINPPITAEERPVPSTRTWYPPDVKNVPPPSSQQPSLIPKDFYNNQTSSTAPYRISVTKSPTNLHMYNTTPAFNKSPKVLKRPTHLIPIAPAPTTIMNVPTSIVSRNDMVSSEHTSPESDMDQPQMSRFTLTSDNRMIPTPPENRGRPRKIRVEKTHQVPKGTAQEVARTRGVADSPVMRKHPPSPVVRASVIQGSVHGSMEGTQALAKPNDRSANEDHLLLQHHTRCFDGNVAEERERFALLANTSAELRTNPEKYKDFSGLFQGMYRSSRTGRSAVLSPPSSSTVTSSMDSIPPVITHESLSQYKMAYENLKASTPDHRNFIDIHRGKSDISRVVTPDQLRPPESSRKTPLSPQETLSIQSYMARAEMAEKERRLNEFHSPVSRYQPPPGLRPDYPVIRGESRALFDHRGSVDDKEHEKKLRMQRDRFLPTPPIMHHGNPTSSHSSPSQAHHSNNLVLGRADGAIIGPLGSYDYRNSEQKR